MTRKEYNIFLNKINHRFARDCWSHIETLDNRNKKIEFLKLLYKLNLLCQKFSDRLDDLKLFSLDNPLPEFLNDYYGGIIHVTQNNQVQIDTCRLFPNAIRIVSDIDGVFIEEQNPNNMFTFFCTSNDPLILFWMKQVKEENKVSNTVIGYMIMFAQQSKGNVRLLKDIVNEFRKKFRPEGDEAKEFDKLRKSYERVINEVPYYHKKKRKEIEEAINFLTDENSIATGKKFLKTIP